jgi:hypothetical protein
VKSILEHEVVWELTIGTHNQFVFPNYPYRNTTMGITESKMLLRVLWDSYMSSKKLPLLVILATIKGEDLVGSTCIHSVRSTLTGQIFCPVPSEAASFLHVQFISDSLCLINCSLTSSAKTRRLSFI